jgi:hypothetical protein
MAACGGATEALENDDSGVSERAKRGIAITDDRLLLSASTREISAQLPQLPQKFLLNPMKRDACYKALALPHRLPSNQIHFNSRH